MKKNAYTGFVFFLIVFIGAIAWFFFYYTPTKGQIRDIRGKIAVLDRKIKQDIPETQILAVQQETDSLVSSLQRRKTRVYPMSDFLLLGRRVQEAINKYDLTLVSLNPMYEKIEEAQRDTSEIAELPMTIVLKGRYSGFTRLLDEQNEWPFLIRAEAFDLKREDIAKSTVLFSIKGVIFLKKEASVSKPRTVPVPAGKPKT
ncbi:MAG: hypothetical protein QUS35_03225 [bacterium]|nr:hypothetical protein [bacterium]